MAPSGPDSAAAVADRGPTAETLVGTTRPRDRILHWGAYSATFAAGAAWTTRLMLASPGVPVHDEIGHVLIAKFAWQHPSYLLDAWGRPVNTLTYFIASHWGMAGARAMSVVLAGAIVAVATLIAKDLGLRHLWVVPVLVWFQPWFNDLSYAAITEVPFTLALLGGIALALRRRTMWASLLFGMLPLIRHEGIVLLGAWGLYVLVRRRWSELAPALGPIFAYEIAFRLVEHRSAIAEIYLAPKVTTLYGSGGWAHFMPAVARGVGVAVLVLAVVGVPRIASLGRRALVFAPFALYLITHTALYRFGLYGSGGYGLFLLPLSGGFALAAALGVQTLIDGHARLHGAVRNVVRYAGPVLAGAGLVAATVIGFQTDPRPLDPDGVAIKEAAVWLRAHDVPRERILASHAWLYVFYDLPFAPGPPLSRITPAPLDRLPPGSVVVWDRHYSDRVGVSLRYLADPAHGWRRDAVFGGGFAVIFTKPSR